MGSPKISTAGGKIAVARYSCYSLFSSLSGGWTLFSEDPQWVEKRADPQFTGSHTLWSPACACYTKVLKFSWFTHNWHHVWDCERCFVLFSCIFQRRGCGKINCSNFWHNVISFMSPISIQPVSGMKQIYAQHTYGKICQIYLREANIPNRYSK